MNKGKKWIIKISDQTKITFKKKEKDNIKLVGQRANGW